MGKRHPNLPAWQWRQYPQNHQHPTNLALHKNSPGYRLILNNILFPAAKKKEKKT